MVEDNILKLFETVKFNEVWTVLKKFDKFQKKRKVHLLLAARGNIESSLSLNLAFELYLLNAWMLPIFFITFSFSFFLVSSIFKMSFPVGHLVLSLILSLWDSLTLSLFSVLLVPPFEGNELEPKSNLTVGMWTNSGWLVGLKLLLVSGLPLVAWVDWKAWDVVLVVFVGFLFFNEDSVVVDWGIWPAEKAPTSSVSFVLNK